MPLRIFVFEATGLAEGAGQGGRGLSDHTEWSMQLAPALALQGIHVPLSVVACPQVPPQVHQGGGGGQIRTRDGGPTSCL